mmetsp:Transcript_55249/g.131717  ORF Transcript_55249/g.131717 Transcript_55249/m.131717 type:complete len:354 (+) Transcript_55249:145-1206(+)
MSYCSAAQPRDEDKEWETAEQLVQQLLSLAKSGGGIAEFQEKVQALSLKLNALRPAPTRSALNPAPSELHLRRRRDEALQELEAARKQLGAAREETLTLRQALEHGGEALNEALRSQDTLRGLRIARQRSLSPLSGSRKTTRSLEVVPEICPTIDCSNASWMSSAAACAGELDHVERLSGRVSPLRSVSPTPVVNGLQAEASSQGSASCPATVPTVYRVPAQRSVSTPMVHQRDTVASAGVRWDEQQAHSPPPRRIVLERRERILSPSSKSVSPPRGACATFAAVKLAQPVPTRVDGLSVPAWAAPLPSACMAPPAVIPVSCGFGVQGCAGRGVVRSLSNPRPTLLQASYGGD